MKQQNIKFDTSLVLQEQQWVIMQVKKEKLFSCLRTMGRDYLKNKKMEWSPDNPSRNYCYVISEWLYRYRIPPIWQPVPFKLEVPGDQEYHYFIGLYIKDKTFGVIDLSKEQFDFKLDYSQAKKFAFMKTAGPQPSKRAQLLEHLYNGENINNFEYINKDNWR